MKLTHSVPIYDERYCHQKELSPVTDDEYEENDTPWKSTIKDRIIQTFFFIVFLGWLRLFIIAILTLIYIIIMSPIILTAKNQSIVKYLTPYGIFITRIYFRIVFFLCGMYVIKIKGKIDQKARLMAFNHHSVFDGPLIFIYRPFIVIAMIELSRVPIVGQILTSVKTLFVDRSKNGGGGTSKVITDYLESNNEEPMALAPEGRCTKGNFLLQFRTGSFIAKEPIQPVTVRYTQFLPFGKTGVVWTHGHLVEWIFRLMSMPGCIVELNFMPTIGNDEYFSKTPAERALTVNLAMANELGTMASNRTNKCIFQKNSKEHGLHLKQVSINNAL